MSTLRPFLMCVLLTVAYGQSANGQDPSSKPGILRIVQLNAVELREPITSTVKLTFDSCATLVVHHNDTSPLVIRVADIRFIVVDECIAGTMAVQTGIPLARTHLDIRVTPNPLRNRAVIDVTTSLSSSVTITIADTKGQIIRHLSPTAVATGKATIEWDATDELGKEVPSQTYIVVAQAGNDTAAQLVQLIR